MSDPTDVGKTQPRGRVQPVPSRETILDRQRVRRITSLRPYAALVSVLFGLGPIAGEFWLYYTTPHALNPWAMLIGGTFMFIGAYMLNHQDAKDMASFIITNGITVAQAIPAGIANAIRAGRRSTDTAVVVVPPPDPVAIVREDRQAIREELPPTLPENER